jgi:hypothetical protein
VHKKAVANEWNAITQESSHSPLERRRRGSFQSRIACHTQVKIDNTDVRTHKIAIAVIILAWIKMIANGIDSRMGLAQRYPRESQAKSKSDLVGGGAEIIGPENEV